jgi:hypothetical protein
MTRAEFFARFPFQDPEPVAVDDGSLSVLLDAALERSRR